MMFKHSVKDNPLICDSKFYKEDRNTCTVIAWTNIFECTYEKSYQYLHKYGRKHKKGMTIQQLNKAFLGVQKAKIKKGPYSSDNRISLGKFITQHPNGRYYVVVRGHALSVINGTIIDYSEKPRRQVVAAWRVYLEGEL